MKPSFEKIEAGFGRSFSIKKFDVQPFNGPPHWHFHPEYEIVFISNGSGKRHIGNHVSYYNEGDLIFLGPNLPHFNFNNEITEPHKEVVVQMKEGFLGEDFLNKPEMSAIRGLFERSRSGISFKGAIREEVGRQLLDMENTGYFEGLIQLLEILNKLAISNDYEILNATGLTINIKATERKRIETIYRYVQEHFMEPIRLEDIASEVSMTIPAFCRYFKKLTKLTFTRFVNEFRIAHASKLLLEADLTIAEVAFDSGFNNLSHFNKQFRSITGSNPRDFRKAAGKIVQKTN